MSCIYFHTVVPLTHLDVLVDRRCDDQRDELRGLVPYTYRITRIQCGVSNVPI